MLDPKRVILKTTMSIKTVLTETNQTYEDSSCVSERISESLRASTIKLKSITIDFTQNIHEIVKVGQKVDPKTILMVIEDEITSTSSAFDEESLLALRNLAKQAPRAKYDGVIDRIEVYYHGSKEDMSNSLRELADMTDKRLSDIHRSSGKPVITGQVNSDYNVEGVPLALDRAEIKIYIKISTSCAVGDKVIFANQLKSVIGEVMNYRMYTKDGEEIDAMFSNRAIAARVVNSPYIIGTTISLLNIISAKAVQLYRG